VAFRQSRSRLPADESRASVVLPGCVRPPRWGPAFFIYLRTKHIRHFLNPLLGAGHFSARLFLGYDFNFLSQIGLILCYFRTQKHVLLGDRSPPGIAGLRSPPHRCVDRPFRTRDRDSTQLAGQLVGSPRNSPKGSRIPVVNTSSTTTNPKSVLPWAHHSEHRAAG